MTRYRLGDIVRVYIPDETDPDHQNWHGEHGIVINVVQTRRGIVYEVGLERYQVVLTATDRDLRPPFKPELDSLIDRER